MNVPQAAKVMLDELRANRLEVCMVPGDRGGYYRVPVTQNAPWYQEFCRDFERPRRRYPKPRTIIKRCHTIRALGELIAGHCDTDYAQRLLPYVRDFAGIHQQEQTL